MKSAGSTGPLDLFLIFKVKQRMVIDLFPEEVYSTNIYTGRLRPSAPSSNPVGFHYHLAKKVILSYSFFWRPGKNGAYKTYQPRCDVTSVTMIMWSVSHVVSGTSCNRISGKSRIDRSDLKSFVVVFKLKLWFISFTSQHTRLTSDSNDSKKKPLLAG